MKCPCCLTELSGLARYCADCGDYIEDMTEEPSEWSVTLPLPPNRANAREHWGTRHRKRIRYIQECDTLAPSRLPKFEDPVRLSARLFVWSKMDEDNLVARCKDAIDWLVRRKVIVDDHPDCLTLGDVSQEIDRKRQRVEITLEAVA